MTLDNLVNRDRQAAVERLYFQNFAFIKELVTSDPTLHFETSDKITHALARELRHYRGPLTDESFRQWVADAILPALSFASIYEHCADAVRTAIRKVFASCLDLGITSDHYADAEQSTWLWAWEHHRKLRDPGKAKTSTRLYSVAKFQALTIRKSLIRAKERYGDVELSRIGADASEYEFSGPVIEPPSVAQFDAYERRETVGATV